MRSPDLARATLAVLLAVQLPLSVAFLTDRVRSAPDRALAWTGSADARVRTTLGPRTELWLALVDLPQDAWIACREWTSESREFLRLKQVGHLVRPRVLLPDVAFVEQLAAGRVPASAPVYWLDPTDQRMAPPPAVNGELVARGERFSLWRMEIRRR